MENEKDFLPPKLKEELAEAGRKAVAAQIEFENSIRGFTSPKEIFDRIFWLMFEGVEVKQSDAVNNLLAQIAEPVKPGSRSSAYGNAYGAIREFYITGATDADRRRIAKALEENENFQRAKRHHAGKEAGEKAPALEVETIEELHRQYIEAGRWIEENRRACFAAWKKKREAGRALREVKAKVREYIKTNGMCKDYENLLNKFEVLQKGLKRGYKTFCEVLQERAGLDRAIDTAADAAPDAGLSESRAKAGESGKDDRKQIPKLF